MSAPSVAQTSPAATTAEAPAASDVDAKIEAARREVKELREEMRAQLATASAAQGWQEDWVEEKRKLELFSIDGYLRVRPDLFFKFDLGRPADDAGFTLFPRSPVSNSERTNAGVNMRFRFEPTINVSEEVRIRMQIDALDNLIWGSTPEYAYSRNGPAYWPDRYDLSVFSSTQVPQRSGINSLQDSIAVKRVWGEVSTPVGILRFGRMGSHWGTGILHNDGNGIDNDWGDTVDRVMFTAEPLSGFYITPMLDFNSEGTGALRLPEGGQPFDVSNSDEAHSYILAAARRDTDSEAKAKLDSGQAVFNYGLHFTYRNQRNDPTALNQAFTTDGTNLTGSNGTHVFRDANLFMPDLWAKYERKSFRIEAELAAIMGWLKPFSTAAADRNIEVWQFGGVLQGEYKFLNGDLEVGGEAGFASGDNTAGMGNYPRRKGSGPNGATKAGDIDGPQWDCQSATNCNDRVIRNFRFNRDHRVDMILYREILGGVTDSFYLKPRISYRITQGFNVFLAGIYSRAIYAESTPLGTDPNLGVELNGGAKYETEDGFYAQVQYGILFPLAGLGKLDATGTAVPLDFAQALRANIGIKF